MSLALYMDVHVAGAIARALLLREVDVITAQLDGTTTLSDPNLLDRAANLGRVLFSEDQDLLREAARRQRSGQFFAGVIFAHQLGITIGRCVADLELLAKCGEPSEFVNRVEYLPF